MTAQWNVAQIFSKREHRIASEMRAAGKDVYQPSYERRWISGGKLSSKPTALMPGYLFFADDGMPPKDAMGRDIEGVIRVLGGTVRQNEYDRMRWECDLRMHDDELPEVVSTEHRRRRRRPRPSRRARMRAEKAAA